MSNESHANQPLLRVIPLGGLGSIGKNMMVIESGDDIIIVDAGLCFPPAKCMASIL